MRLVIATNSCQSARTCWSARNLTIINPLSNNNFLDWSKLKAFADEKTIVTPKLNLIWKGLKTLWEIAFPSFSHNILKAFIL